MIALAFASVDARTRHRNWMWTLPPIVVPVDPIEAIALREIRADVAGAPDGCLRFFDLLFARSCRADRSKTISAAFGMGPSTLISRFWRAQLPSPRMYARYATFVILAGILDDERISFTRAAMEIEASSSQTTYRTVRHFLGLTANEFRRTYSGRGMLDRFRAELVLPYVDHLRAFDPTAMIDVRRQRAS